MRVIPTLAAGVLCLGTFGQASAGDGHALQIIVSKDMQQVTVYDGLDIVAQSNVSTGKPGHTTPSGIFSILEKRKFHRSNLYNDAPMPWMQRITWSGVALHQSNHVPRRPASHGCIRLPSAFAKDLFQLTERGAHVIVSDRPVQPQLLSGDVLLKPNRAGTSPSLTDVPLRASIGSTSGETVEVAMNEPALQPGEAMIDEADLKPIYVMITRTSEQHRIADVQTRLNALGYDTGEVDGIVGRRTLSAIRDFRAVYDLPAEGGIDEALADAIANRDGKGPISNGRIMVRQNFKDVFSAGVTIDEPEKALGTHFMEARNVSGQDGTVTWYGVSLENHLNTREAERLGVTEPADDFATYNLPAKALARIHIPAEARARIEAMLSEGSAITITDTGYQRETGLGTNFITLTRRPPAS